MQMIFGSGVATGKFAMSSNEMGTQSEPGTIDLDQEAPQAQPALSSILRKC
jgi:hypothetical protein